MEREKDRNSNIEGADTTGGSGCDRFPYGDGAEEAGGVSNEGDRVATIETINDDIMDVEDIFHATKK